MLRSAILLMSCVLVGACTVIKIGPGDTQTIDFEGNADVARDLTTRACRRARQQSAEIISIENKDPARPAGTGRQNRNVPVLLRRGTETIIGCDR